MNKFKKEKEFESEEKSVVTGKMKKISDQKNLNEGEFDMLDSNAAGMDTWVQTAVT